MLHIFLTILKIPLLLLGILLSLVFITVLLTLFVPVRYQARIVKNDRFHATFRVHWLFHFLSVCVNLAGKEPELSVKLLGFPLIGGEKKERGKNGRKRKPKAEKEQPEPDASRETSDAEKTDAKEPDTAKTDAAEQSGGARDAEKRDIEEQRIEEQNVEDQNIEDQNIKDQNREAQNIKPQDRKELSAKEQIIEKKTSAEPDAKTPDVKMRGAKNPLHSFLERMCAVRDKIKAVYRRAQEFLELWRDEHTQLAIRHGRCEIFYILKHYLPGNLQGRLLFGLSDPAATGQALGLLCILQAFTGNHLLVEADFEHPALECDVSFQGHVRVCHTVKSALALLLDKHCRLTFGRIRRFAFAQQKIN